jgi:hypothetical protein
MSQLEDLLPTAIDEPPFIVNLDQDCDCDELPGARGSLTEPLILYNARATFSVGLPLGGALRASLKAPAWINQGPRATVFQCDREWRFDKSSGLISLDLMPDAVNWIRLVHLRPDGSISAPIDWRIYSRASVVFTPPGLVFWLLLDVTDAELDAELAKMIAEASKVSKELADFLKDNVVYSDDDDSKTGLIDQTQGKTKANTRIRISKSQIKEALAAIKEAADADKPGKQEALFRKFLEVLLHEASHRKGIIDGVSGGTISEEEDRNTKALIQRLLELLKKLKTHLPGQPVVGRQALGDGDGLKDLPINEWMDRLREALKGEKNYRWIRVVRALAPWKDKYNRVRGKWDEFKRKLKEIKDDTTKNADQKKAAAAAAYDAFNTDDVKADRSALEQEFDEDWKQTYDPDTLEPSSTVTPTDKYKGEIIP